VERRKTKSFANSASRSGTRCERKVAQTFLSAFDEEEADRNVCSTLARWATGFTTPWSFSTLRLALNHSLANASRSAAGSKVEG